MTKSKLYTLAVPLASIGGLVCLALLIPALQVRLINFSTINIMHKHFEQEHFNRAMSFISTISFKGLVSIVTLFICIFFKKIPFRLRCLLAIIVYSSLGIHVRGDDIGFHLGRIAELSTAIQLGEIPTHFNFTLIPHAGNGVGICYPELFLYIPALFHVLGVSLYHSYNTFCILMNITAILIAFYTIKEISHSENIAVIFAALYGTCLYRISDIVSRAAIGEALGMTFMPLVILGVYRLFLPEHRWLTLTVAMSALLQSHFISVFLAGVWLLFYLICNIRHIDRYVITSLLKATLASLALNLWFIIPFLYYSTEIQFSFPGSLFNTTVKIPELFAPFETESNDAHSLGVPILVGLILFIRTKQKRKYAVVSGLGLLALFMASDLFPWAPPPSRSTWLPVNIFNQLQFATRFYIIAAPLLCIPASVGYYRFFIRKNKHYGKYKCMAYFSGFCMLCSLYFTASAIIRPDWPERDIFFFSSDSYYKNSDPDYTKRNQKPVKSSDAISISDYTQKRDKIQFTYSLSDSKNNNYVELPLYDFKGYKALLNKSQPLKIEKGKNNYIRIELPESDGTVTVEWKRPLIFIWGYCISLLSLLFIAYSYRLRFSRIYSSRQK
jgi:hypothetical protein